MALCWLWSSEGKTRRERKTVPIGIVIQRIPPRSTKVFHQQPMPASLRIADACVCDVVNYVLFVLRLRPRDRIERAVVRSAQIEPLSCHARFHLVGKVVVRLASYVDRATLRVEGRLPRALFARCSTISKPNQSALALLRPPSVLD